AKGWRTSPPRLPRRPSTPGGGSPKMRPRRGGGAPATGRPRSARGTSRGWTRTRTRTIPPRNARRPRSPRRIRRSRRLPPPCWRWRSCPWTWPPGLGAASGQRSSPPPPLPRCC
ncbi:unnamed protein product, partial [Ectocarpus sp. 8 AP-2014]